MLDIDFKTLDNAKFELYEGNPILRRDGLSTIVADPSVLTPADSHDGKWHLFCHTLFGVYRYDGEDGITWHKYGRILPRAMRADVNYIGGVYYLYYERVQALLPKALTLLGGKWFSEIYVTTSRDLCKWTEPVKVVGNERAYVRDERGVAISNPFLLSIDDGYRLYFSAGQTFITDCKFCEPTYISYAESSSPTDGFTALQAPLITPDKDSEYLNLCCGCIKVYRLRDCYIGLQNGIYRDKADGKSKSAIMLLRSDDGKSFEFVKPLLSPQECPSLGKDKDWMRQFVYACNLTLFDGSLNLYFNARDDANPLKGREHIGMMTARL